MQQAHCDMYIGESTPGRGKGDCTTTSQGRRDGHPQAAARQEGRSSCGARALELCCSPCPFERIDTTYNNKDYEGLACCPDSCE
eukprot:scaffold1841_cov61-Phaeocystis_antarctica.AAC.7